jgi:hypothetical protein
MVCDRCGGFADYRELVGFCRDFGPDEAPAELENPSPTGRMLCRRCALEVLDLDPLDRLPLIDGDPEHPDV